MALDEINYVPTLAIRASEMNGLEQLPSATKDRMRPVFLLAPWATANTLEKAVERAEKAYPNRRYFLDIDKDYAVTNPEAEAQEQFFDLLSGRNCFENWMHFISGFGNAQPCLQLIGQSIECIREQINIIQNLGREFCVRIEIRQEHSERFPYNLPEIVALLNEIGTADYSVLLEGGWTADPMGLFTRFSGLIGGTLGEVDADVPIIVSCTSMPKDFQDFEGCVPWEFSNRELVSQIARYHNRRRIVYGDWGSTRPREPAGHKQRPLERIDYPTDHSWIIARNKDKEWGFKEAAEELVRQSGVWEDNLNVWGTNMILQTAANPAFGINTPQKNVASRVNIHLHRQAFYGEDIHGIDLDEEWQD